MIAKPPTSQIWSKKTLLTYQNLLNELISFFCNNKIGNESIFLHKSTWTNVETNNPITICPSCCISDSLFMLGLASPPLHPYCPFSHLHGNNYHTGMCCLERVQEGGITKDQLLLWEIDKHLCLTLEDGWLKEKRFHTLQHYVYQDVWKSC
jgi:hypothetical protein